MQNGTSQVARLVKNQPANAGDARDSDSIPGSGRSGEGNGIPLQYSCLGKSHGQKSLVGYSLCITGSDMPEYARTHVWEREGAEFPFWIGTGTDKNKGSYHSEWTSRIQEWQEVEDRGDHKMAVSPCIPHIVWGEH